MVDYTFFLLFEEVKQNDACGGNEPDNKFLVGELEFGVLDPGEEDPHDDDGEETA